MEEAMVLKLHGLRISPYSMRVELALKLKGIPYEYIEEDFANKSQELLRYNPIYKNVPVLVHDGRPIVESLIILEFIEETWKDPPLLHPQDPYRKAKVRFWAGFCDQKLIPRGISVLQSKGKKQVAAKDELIEILKQLEEGLEKDFSTGRQPFFSGEMPGFLDAVLGSNMFVLQAMEEVSGVQLIGPERNPLLFSWLVTFKDFPLVKEVMPPHEYDKAVARTRQVQQMTKSPLDD